MSFIVIQRKERCGSNPRNGISNQYRLKGGMDWHKNHNPCNAKNTGTNDSYNHWTHAFARTTYSSRKNIHNGVKNRKRRIKHKDHQRNCNHSFIAYKYARKWMRKYHNNNGKATYDNKCKYHGSIESALHAFVITRSKVLSCKCSNG